MEQRLIDADALKVSYCKQCLKETGNEQIEVKQTPYCAVACQDFDVIDKQPTVDAVPVVRCSKCRMSFIADESMEPYGAEIGKRYCANGRKVTDDFFCADGKGR
jgi:hypothetical protein